MDSSGCDDWEVCLWEKGGKDAYEQSISGHSPKEEFVPWQGCWAIEMSVLKAGRIAREVHCPISLLAAQ